MRIFLIFIQGRINEIQKKDKKYIFDNKSLNVPIIIIHVNYITKFYSQNSIYLLIG